MRQKLICTTTEKFKEITGGGSPNNTFRGPSRVLFIDPSLEPSAHLRLISTSPEQRQKSRWESKSQNEHHDQAPPRVVPVWTLTMHCWEQLSKSSFRGKRMLPEGWDSLKVPGKRSSEATGLFRHSGNNPGVGERRGLGNLGRNKWGESEWQGDKEDWSHKQPLPKVPGLWRAALAVRVPREHYWLPEMDARDAAGLTDKNTK